MDTSNPSQPKGKRGESGGLQEKPEATLRAAYRISLSAREDAKPFGTTRGGETTLNARGKALAAAWRDLGTLREGVEPDALIIGARRLQGIVLLPRGNDDVALLGEVVRLFKVLTSVRLAHMVKTAAARTGKEGNRKVTPASSNTSAAAAAKAPSALWKKGFTEKSISGSAELAEARKALKGLQAR